MTHKYSWWMILLLALALSIAAPALAQAPTPPTPKDALIQDIQVRAQRDVNLGKQAEGIAELQILFGEEAAQVGLSMAEVLEIYEEAYAEATPDEPWWAELRPNAGWIAAAILFVLFILRDVIQDNLTKLINWLWERAYERLAGYRPLWGIALRRYRKALVGRYEKLKIPFRPGRPLEMREIYVPLKVSGASDADKIDAYRAVTDHKWLMVVGQPGAGKTMLVEHLALRYTEGKLTDFPTPLVPVVLKLNTLNESKDPLEVHLAQALTANDFPGGERFLQAGLEHGLLLLLFDGLDEVNRDARPRVAQQINDLLQAHPECHAVITCRTAVYEGEFAGLVDQQLEIAPFTDQQIQRFLGSWQAEMPPGKTVAHLVRNLRERPRILTLARNPLLLTIIAYLYADTPFVLPHSRAEFYDKALGVLLEQWDQAQGRPNRYKGVQKRLVLQHLALYNQDRGVQRQQDRRSVDLPTLLDEIETALPKLNLKEEDAEPLLEEIVERSGLLLRLDGGQRYQFAHLTLQEFFAAQELQGATADLIERFEREPDAWREVVKLWCGLAHDSTSLLRAVYARDSITAFECLGDAQQVNPDFANEIIATFRARLGEDGASGEAVIHAFALVATDPRERGTQLFDFLAATVTHDADAGRRRAAAQALAQSNLPQAAVKLAECAPEHPWIRPLLVQMGDLAMPVLAQWAGQGEVWAFDALQEVGTPQAAYELTNLLWVYKSPLPYQAAWRLGTLFDAPNVEAALRDYPLTEAQRAAEKLDWVWEPFDPNPDSTLRIITGRVAYLLATTPERALPANDSELLSSRLALPICAISAPVDELKKFEPYDEQAQGLIERYEKLPSKETSSTYEFELAQKALIAEARACAYEYPTWRWLFDTLGTTMQFELLRRLIQEPYTPTVKDWRQAFEPVKYSFEESWHAKGLKAALFLVLALSLWEAGASILRAPTLVSWEAGGYALVAMWWLVGSLYLGLVALNLEAVRLFAFFGVLGLYVYLGLLTGSAWGFLLIFGGVTVALIVVLFSARSVTGVVKWVVALVGALVGALIGTLGGTLGVALVGVLIGLLVGLLVDVLGDDPAEALGSKLFGVPAGVLFGVLGGAFGGVLQMLFFLPNQLLYNTWDWQGIALFWSLWALWFGVLWRLGARREREAQNPLRGLLELQDAPAARYPRHGLLGRLPGSGLVRRLTRR